MTRATPFHIKVERDAEGLRMAVLTLFEEAHHQRQIASVLEGRDEDAKRRALDELPGREISPGYFRQAAYLLDLSTTLELGVPLAPESISRADIVGLTAVRNARNQYEQEHPSCPACGERQDGRGVAQCRYCGTKFSNPGGN